MNTLPPALAPWAPQLSALTDELAVALGPWLADIAGLLAEHDHALAAGGEPDGFDGLSGRGTPERLLVSEWLWATEEPVEFLRRAAENELLHLAPAFRRSAPHARVVVLCDCGPAQWGPARLVQLAVLLVMHRRALTHGVPLALGVLGDEPGKLRGGDLEPLLKGWQRSQRMSEPDDEQIAQWVGTLEAGDEIWMLGGDSVRRKWTEVRHLAIAETGWDSTGVIALTLSLGARDRVLPMPPPHQAVNALRGHGFRGGGGRFPAQHALSNMLRYPVFPGASQVLVGRGDDDSTLITVSVPHGRPRRHRLPAPVVAAGLHSRRLIALTRQSSRLRPHVVGKPLPFLDGAQWPYDGSVVDGPLAPLHLAPDGLLTRLADGWIRLPLTHTEPVDAGIAAVAYGHDSGTPRIAAPTGHPDVRVKPGERVVFGPIPHHCSSLDGRVWTVSNRKTLTVPDGDQVIGLVWIDSQPALVSRSAGGQILRLCPPGAVRTLTRWSSGTITAVATHPRLPWLALAQHDGTVIVADLQSGQRVCELRGTP